MHSPIPADPTTPFLFPAVLTPSAFYARIARAGAYRCFNVMVDTTLNPGDVIIDIELISETNRSMHMVGHGVPETGNTHNIHIELMQPHYFNNGDRLKVLVYHNVAGLVGDPFEVSGDLMEASK